MSRMCSWLAMLSFWPIDQWWLFSEGGVKNHEITEDVIYGQPHGTGRLLDRVFFSGDSFLPSTYTVSFGGIDRVTAVYGMAHKNNGCEVHLYNGKWCMNCGREKQTAETNNSFLPVVQTVKFISGYFYTITELDLIARVSADRSLVRWCLKQKGR